MQEHDNNKNNNIRRMPEEGRRQAPKTNAQSKSGEQPRRQSSSGQLGINGQPRRQAPNGQVGTNGQPRRQAPNGQVGTNGQPRRQAPNGQVGTNGQPRRQAPNGQVGTNGQPRRQAPNGQPGTNGQPRRQRPSGQPDAAIQHRQAGSASGGQPRPAGQKRPNGRPQNTNGKPKKNPQQSAKKKRGKIILFVAEIFLLLILVAALWTANKAKMIQHVEIDPINVHINKDVQVTIDEGTSSMKGYRNIALFGVDSRDKELDKNTRTDVIMVASINQDTKEVRLVSVYRDTWLNMTNDSYSKANAAYARGGAEQAIGMLNMNLDLDITDFITVGFDAVIDVVDAIGGVEIDVKEEEIVHLNSYQISMTGRLLFRDENGGEAYDATPGVDYIPVTHAGLQTLNGVQATAYSRIRYTSGGDGARTERQRRVLTEIAKKAMTMNPATLNKIVDNIFGEISTSLKMSEIVSLLSDVASYKIGETSGFPFSDHVNMAGRVGKASVVVPIDLNKNVELLHEFLFEDSEYTTSATVKRCSERIASDTGISYNGE